ncbi:uncharacterized protein LAJ45_09090 [Morchella importuna]|uniref:Transmembrane protein n=1 Tax=Morchella conica CCBAS932 TaxID=1392247 RepID=A0A3N4L3K7_9PEZI|nr:uncharacterized protein LAJ45_09090 [Morchella importuna]KAH8146716.1 hypothetical protein LAJ45_09090 [Morchella importuna]RPB12595.1 hypothetical protein P167DRAFT_523173 [Morchella conica CCBAS932]
MITLIPDRYVLQEVTRTDMNIASICWGFTLGFGFLTTWEAIRQTNRARDPLRSTYIWMIWMEIIVCLIFSIICWIHLDASIPPSFAFYFCILTLWALQVQFLLQIIINRIIVILADHERAFYMKWGVAALITAVNISVYCIWVPARLQISDRFVHINEVWDRCEKVIYLVVDAILNWYFVRVVRQRLVKQGSAKYNRLVVFNIRIIFLSLLMDCLIIGTMSLKNSFVYMQFHPLAYTVKLMIEMSMANLIRKIASEKNDMRIGTYELSHSTNRNHISGGGPPAGAMMSNGGVVVHKEVIVESRAVEDMDQSSEISGKDQQDDDSPLRNESWTRVAYNTDISTNGHNGPIGHEAC